jgi:alpha-L-rhamnosidase
MKQIYKILFAFVLAACTLIANASEVIVTDNLKCEMLINPKGIDAITPRFNWQVNAVARGVKQLAYQIIVASSPAKLANNEGDLWNSSKVASDKSIQVAYAGKTLQSRQECFWKVKGKIFHKSKFGLYQFYPIYL